MYKGVGVLLLSLLLVENNANAQLFNSTQLHNVAAFDNKELNTLPEPDKVEEELSVEESARRIKWLENEVFLPQGGLNILDKDTEDGSVRGKSFAVEINNEGESRNAEKIFLYSEGFKISGIIKNVVSCDVRFVIMTNLDRKLNQLDVKLVWPKMTSALSFSNVMPNTPTYVDYTLVGEGCYSMDKMPNIVVNRCRVRGMSAIECANKIVWLKMNN